MDGKKIFIAVLILLIIGYIVLTVVGANRQNGQKKGGAVKLDPDSIKEQLGGINLTGIQDSLLPPPALAPTELRLALIGSTSPDCAKLQGELIVPQDQTCSFSVLPVEKNFIGYAPATRKLSLTLTQGDAANLILLGLIKQDGGGEIKTTAEQALLPGVRSKPLDIYQAGGALTITCPAGTAKTDCRLKLAK
jgi:hypothetical protein